VIRVLLVGCIGSIFCAFLRLREPENRTPLLTTAAISIIIFYILFIVFIFVVSFLKESRFERL